MEGNAFRWFKVVQIASLVFTMLLMLSKHYEVFGAIFSIFYESLFSIVCVAVGGFSILHGLYMVYKGITGGHA